MSEIKRLKYCVNNQWLSSATDKYMPVMNPSLGVQIAEAPCCTQSEVDAAVKAAAAAFPAWSDTPIPQRIQLMFRFKALLDKNLDELAARLGDAAQRAAITGLQQARWAGGDVAQARAALVAAFAQGPRWKGAAAPADATRALLPPLYPDRRR